MALIHVDKPCVKTGLPSLTYTADETTLYVLRGNVNVVPDSSVVVTIQVNLITVGTFQIDSTTQNHLEFKLSMQATNGQAITIVLTSANVNDNQLNQVKSTFILTKRY